MSLNTQFQTNLLAIKSAVTVWNEEPGMSSLPGTNSLRPRSVSSTLMIFLTKCMSLVSSAE